MLVKPVFPTGSMIQIRPEQVIPLGQLVSLSHPGLHKWSLMSQYSQFSYGSGTSQIPSTPSQGRKSSHSPDGTHFPSWQMYPSGQSSSVQHSGSKHMLLRHWLQLIPSQSPSLSQYPGPWVGGSVGGCVGCVGLVGYLELVEYPFVQLTLSGKSQTGPSGYRYRQSKTSPS